MPDVASTPTGYLRDILDQPIAVRDTVAALPDVSAWRPFAGRLASGDLRRVVLTGMGSSYHVLHPIYLAVMAGGLTVHMIETSELIHYAPALLDPHTLLVLVSQSGRSIEVLALLERIRGRIPLVGVTNTPDSPLAAQADAVLLTHAGHEFSVSSKTYVAALAALAWLSDALIGQDPLPTRRALEQAPGALEQYLAHWTNYVKTLGEQLAGSRFLVLVGRGPSLAAVGTGALIVKEAAYFPAEGLSSAAFRHGPLEMAAPDIFVLVYSGAPTTAELNARLADDIRAIGGRAALVHESALPDVFALPPLPEVARPILEILPAQMLSLALAQLKGHEPGRFGRIPKVALVE